MSLEHQRYRALGHQEADQNGQVVHKVWLRGTVPDHELGGAETVEHLPEGLSGDPETVVTFLGRLPFWIVIYTSAN